MIELKATHYNYHHPDKIDEEISMTTDEPNLHELVGFMARFLKAIGYHFEGHLEIVEDD
jgi:hypothetical protein